MDIYECHDRFGITLKKLRRMIACGVLKLEKEKTPEYWRQVVSDVQKGIMSARSIALVSKFPNKLHDIVALTRANRAVIKSHFEKAGLPSNDPELVIRLVAPVGAAQKDSRLMAEFIDAIKRIIPDHDVEYHYLAARLLLTCDTDFQINLMSEFMTRAFSSVRDEVSMNGWWHKEPGNYGKEHTVYHRPRRYDL